MPAIHAALMGTHVHSLSSLLLEVAKVFAEMHVLTETLQQQCTEGTEDRKFLDDRFADVKFIGNKTEEATRRCMEMTTAMRGKVN